MILPFTTTIVILQRHFRLLNVQFLYTLMIRLSTIIQTAAKLLEKHTNYHQRNTRPTNLPADFWSHLHVQATL